MAKWLSEVPSATLIKGATEEPEPLKGLKILKKISHKAPLAIGMVEELTGVASTGELDDGLAAELSKLQAIFGSSDALEGLSALLERRRPAYKGM